VQRYPLDQKLLTKVRELVNSKAPDQSFPLEWPRGFFIRIRGNEASYSVQSRGPKKTVKRKICSINGISFEKIRTIALEAIEAIKNERDVDAVIKAHLRGRDPEQALDVAEAAKLKLWTFREAIDAYTSRQETQDGKLEPRLAPSSITEINSRLRDRSEATAIMDRYVKELRLKDLEQVRDAIAAHGTGASCAPKFVDLSKRVLDWGARLHRSKTGLDPALPWWNGLAHEYRPGDRSGRALTPDQTGMLIALLEAVRPLEQRSNDAVLGAIQLDWLILQRSQALVGMEGLQSAKWEDDPYPNPKPDRAGWRIYTWEAKSQKGKRVIKLSLPPSALQILQRVSDNFEKTIGIRSRWAFPQINNKYFMRAKFESEGSIGELDKHITNSSMYQMLSALGGRRQGWPNLLEIVGLPDLIGPHDLRRTITEFFENIGETAYASALLDHKVTGVDKMSREVAALTQRTYSAAHRVDFKAEGLNIWLSVVMPAYEKAKNDSRIAEAVKARKESLERSQAAGSEKRRQTRAANRSAGGKKRRARMAPPESINSNVVVTDRLRDHAPDRKEADVLRNNGGEEFAWLDNYFRLAAE
jgi:hypothetical protein